MRRLPRFALWLFCVAYVLPGFFGRDAWKSADMAALGYMAELASGHAAWMAPTLLGMAPEHPALLPYWLGAGALHLAPAWLPGDMAVRLPFIALLTLTLISAWYGTYYLARTPLAQPVAFAFGGEASPTDYARAMADGGLLALIACLGLAQLAHETTPAVIQLGSVALLFYGISALPYHRLGPAIALVVGLLGLALSGAPAIAVALGVGCALIHGMDRASVVPSATEHAQTQPIARQGVTLFLLTMLVAGLVAYLGLWRWKIDLPHASWPEWNGILQMLLWFTWPAWPLAGWTLWRWRHQLFNRRMSRHMALPFWFALVPLVAALCTGSSDRTLLLALPALASLAAFALPTLQRQVAALIDWFTLLFFSGCGIIIWVVWIAMQTGIPAQPAANVARLAPGFSASFSWLQLIVAVAATLVWAWLVKWRVGRHRAAIWKSLVLPAGGAALCWLLLMTLWMPLLNYARSYSTLVEQTARVTGGTGCIAAAGLSQGQIAAFQFYGKLQLQPFLDDTDCQWALIEPDEAGKAPPNLPMTGWHEVALAKHPADSNESVLIFRRQ